jgi:hypothetical protein
VLLAPITVTPTKPLTPSHLKGLLWTDVMYRATSRLADVSYRYSPTTYHPTEQTLAFWEYLDRALGDVDYAELSEEDIGALYVRHRAEPTRTPFSVLRSYAEAVETCGWVHPATTRVLELWTTHYARLGMHDPGLTRHQPPGFGLEEALEHLDVHGMCLDHRDVHGPVYLDQTRFGLPLRQIVSADGQPNYLACALRELLPLAPDFDEIVLLYDREMDADYQLLERALSTCGPTVRRVPIGRVPIDGTIRSARHGDWRGLDAAALVDTMAAGHSSSVLRLGMRLYFIASLGPGQRESFREDLLRQSLQRATRLLDVGQPGEPGLDPTEHLARQRREHHYVDPYRLTTSLLAKHRPAPTRELLEAVFL